MFSPHLLSWHCPSGFASVRSDFVTSTTGSAPPGIPANVGKCYALICECLKNTVVEHVRMVRLCSPSTCHDIGNQ